MILILYYFLLGLKIFFTGICAIFCWKIARLKFSPTTTYYLFMAAFTLRLVTQLQGIIYTRDILGFLSGYNVWLIIETQTVEVIIITCFTVGILRKYASYQHLPFMNGPK